jgi:hypothetical protein
MLAAGVAVVLVGGAGAGKTACLAATAARAAAHSGSVVAHTALRAGAGPGCLERVLTDRMQRHRIGRWRPRNAASLLLCVDDLHVPAVAAAAQSGHPAVPGAFEFLRQLVSTGTFWDTASGGGGGIGGDASVEGTRVLVAGRLRSLVSAGAGGKTGAGAATQQLLRLLLPVRTDSEPHELPPAHVLAAAALPSVLSNSADAGIAVATRDAIAAASAHLVALLGAWPGASFGFGSPSAASRAIPEMDITAAAAIVRGTVDAAAATGISHAAAWRNEARRVLRDRLADPSEQIAFDRAAAAAAAAHLAAGAAGPLGDALAANPVLDETPVAPTAIDTALAIARCTAADAHSRMLARTGAVSAKSGSRVPTSVFGPDSRTGWPDAATHVARTARALRCAWGEGGHLMLLGGQASGAGTEDLARATAIAEGADCIVVHALASPSGVEEMDAPDATAETVRALMQAVKLAGAGGRRVVLLVSEGAAACDASLAPLHECVAAGGRAPGRVTDLQLAVWLHDKKRAAKSGLSGEDLSGVALDARAAEELAAGAKADAGAKAQASAATLKAKTVGGEAAREKKATRVEEAAWADAGITAGTGAETGTARGSSGGGVKSDDVPGGMRAAEARAAEFAAGVRNNLRIVCCTDVARWAIIVERFPALARACTVNVVLPINDERLTEHLMTRAAELGLDRPTAGLMPIAATTDATDWMDGAELASTGQSEAAAIGNAAAVTASGRGTSSGDDAEEDKVAAVSVSNASTPEAHEALRGIAGALCDMHRAAVAVAAEFARTSGRVAAVRRERAVEALRVFARLHTTQRAALEQRRKTLRTAVRKLEEADTGRRAVEARLAAIAPRLNSGVAASETNLIAVAAAVRDVDTRRAEILAEEERIARVSDQVARVRAEGVVEMGTAGSVYDGAMASLADIEATDLDELRSYPTPPGLVRIVMEAVCLLMNGDPGDWDSARAFLTDSSNAAKKKKRDAKRKAEKKREENASEAGGRGGDEAEDGREAHEGPSLALAHAPLLQRLRQYRREDVEDDTVRRLQKYVRASSFTPRAVQQVSVAARSLCEWVLAVDGFAKVRAAVRYKETKLREADAKVATTRASLALKAADLAAAQQSLALLQEEHGEARREKEALEVARAEAQMHLEHIKSLVDAFAAQRRRWGEAAQEAAAAAARVTGDSLAAAAAIAYLGPFDEVFRLQLSAQWGAILARRGIPCDPDFNLAQFLRRLHPSGALPLPAGDRLDAPLTDSLLLALYAAKPPLLLDPEGEAPGLLRRAITASQETAAGKAGAEAARSGRWTLLRAAEEGAVERAGHALESGANVMLSLDGAVSPPSPALVALVARSPGPPVPAYDAAAAAATATLTQESTVMTMTSVAICPRGMLVMHLRGTNPAVPHALMPLCSPVLFLAGAQGLEERLLSCIARHVASHTEENLRALDKRIAADEQTFAEVEAKVTAFVARGGGGNGGQTEGAGAGGAVWDDSALVDSLVASTASLEGLRKRAAAARTARAAAAEKLMRYRGIAQLAAVLHVLCRDMSARDPRYALPFVQHAGIFRRALTLTRVVSKGTTQPRPRSASRARIAGAGLASDAAAAADNDDVNADPDDDELGGPGSEPPPAEMRELELATLRTQVSLVGQRLPLALREALHVLLAARVLLTAGVLAPEEWEFLGAGEARGGGCGGDGGGGAFTSSASALWPGPELARSATRLEAAYATAAFQGLAASLADPTEAPAWRAWLINPTISATKDILAESVAAAAVSTSSSTSVTPPSQPAAAAAAARPPPFPVVATSRTSARRSPHLPGEWNDRLGSFHRLVLLQALAPAGFAAAAAAFAAPFVGAERGDAQHQLLAAAAADAGSMRPVLLHSTPAGEDAASALTHASIVLGHRQPPTFVFLGQGGAAAAERAIARGRKDGTWVVLMHVETEPAWLPRLSAMMLQHEALLAKDPGNDSPHPGHTLWICCSGSAVPSLPPALVTVCALAALEPPTSVRAGLLRCLAAAAAAEHRAAEAAERQQQQPPGLCFFGPLPASVAASRAAAEPAARDLAGWQRHVMGFAIGYTTP